MKEIELTLMLVGVVCVIGLALPLSRLYDWELGVCRKLGWNGYADRWERRKSWWLPVNQWFMAVLAAGCIVALYTMK